MRLSFFLTAVACFTACAPRHAGVKAPAPAAPKPSVDVSLPAPNPVRPASTTAEEKLDAPLLALVRAARLGPGDVALKQLPGSMEVKENKVKVEITAVRTKPIAEVRKRLLELGADITAEVENHIWAFVSPAAVDQISREEFVWTVRAAVPSVSSEKK